ncbi:transposase [Candidatus Acetothermia bacterium]|nr:transposase [Candidatus Acetothermia bacterium]
MFQTSRTALAASIRCLGDAGYQGLSRFHAPSQTPIKRCKRHPLSAEQKAANRRLAQQRITVEHLLRKLKVFRILSERYRNRRQRFRLRFNLIAALYNFELRLPPNHSHSIVSFEDTIIPSCD